MKKVKNEAEREAFLAEHIESGGGYFVVTHAGETELLWFTQYKNWCDDGSDWYLEAPCNLHRIKTTHAEDEAYYTGIGYVLKEDGYAYEVDSPQVSPFLPEEIELTYLGQDEEVAVNWLLKTNYASYDWRN